MKKKTAKKTKRRAATRRRRARPCAVCGGAGIFRPAGTAPGTYPVICYSCNRGDHKHVSPDAIRKAMNAP